MGSCMQKIKKFESCLVIVGGVVMTMALIISIFAALDQQEIGFTFFINWSMVFNFNFTFQFAICVNIVQMLCGINLLSDVVEGTIKGINKVRTFLWGTKVAAEQAKMHPVNVC